MDWLVAHFELDPAYVFRNWMRRAMWFARYAKIPPSESMRYPRSYLLVMEEELEEIIRGESPEQGMRTD